MPLNFPNTTASNATAVFGTPSTNTNNQAIPIRFTYNGGAWNTNTWVTPSQYFTESIAPTTASVLFANRATSASYAPQAGIVYVNYSGSASPLSNVYSWFNAASGSGEEQNTNFLRVMRPFADQVNTSNGDWNPSTGVFTVRTPGIYKFTAFYQLKQTLNNTIVPQSGWNLSLITASNFTTPVVGTNPSIQLASNYSSFPGQMNTGFTTRTGTITLYCRYGDTFSFTQSTNATGIYYLQSGLNSWITIQQLA